MWGRRCARKRKCIQIHHKLLLKCAIKNYNIKQTTEMTVKMLLKQRTYYKNRYQTEVWMMGCYSVIAGLFIVIAVVLFLFKGGEALIRKHEAYEP